MLPSGSTRSCCRTRRSTLTPSRTRSITRCGSCKRRYHGSRRDGRRTSTWVREKGDGEGVREKRHDEGREEGYTGLTNGVGMRVGAALKWRGGFGYVSELARDCMILEVCMNSRDKVTQRDVRHRRARRPRPYSPPYNENWWDTATSSHSLSDLRRTPSASRAPHGRPCSPKPLREPRRPLEQKLVLERARAARPSSSHIYSH
jgi:hypothetical protein